MTSPSSISPGHRAQPYAPTLIAIVVVATIQPLVVITTAILPLQLNEPPWRVRVAGLILGVAPQLGVGLAVIGAIGLFAGIRRAVRGAALAAIALAVLLIVLLVLDLLDVLQVRRMVPVDRLPAFKVNAMQTFGVAAVLVPALLWAGIGGWQAGFKDVARRSPGGDMAALPGTSERHRS